MDTLNLGDALFSTTRQRVLALLYGSPDRSFYGNEIARCARVGKGNLMRELERLRQSGIVRVSQQGNQTHYQANPDCPIYGELLGIVRKTFGMGELLRAALEPFSGHITWAFIYGSVAKGTEHSASDIDLMVIGESLGYSAIMERLLPVEEQLSRTINPTLYELGDWRAKKAAGNSFVVRVEQQEKIELIGFNPDINS